MLILALTGVWHYWRPVWDLCKKIQAEFKGYKGYKTRDEHQAAWNRFEALRNWLT